MAKIKSSQQRNSVTILLQESFLFVYLCVDYYLWHFNRLFILLYSYSNCLMFGSCAELLEEMFKHFQLTVFFIYSLLNFDRFYSLFSKLIQYI